METEQVVERDGIRMIEKKEIRANKNDKFATEF